MKFDREKYLSYCFDTVKRLMDVPSPSGYSREIASLLADMAQEQELGFEATKKSCFFMTYEGKSHESSLGVAQSHFLLRGDELVNACFFPTAQNLKVILVTRICFDGIKA